MRYERQTFEGATVSVDGNEVIECRFVCCRLVYEGGSFSIRGTTLLERTVFTVSGPARGMLTFLRLARDAGIDVNDLLNASAAQPGGVHGDA